MEKEAFFAWTSECATRRAYIRGLTKEWKKRIAERRIVVKQWDDHVAEARNAVVYAKSFPAPPRPK